MPGSDHSDHSFANGSGEARHLLDFVRQPRETLLLPAGSILFKEGEPCRGVYYVEDGELYLTITSGGRELKVGSAKAGHLMAISSVVSSTGFQCSAHAACDSKLTFIPAEEMLKYLRQHAEICLLTVQRLGAELLELSETAIRPLRLQPRYPKPQ